MKLECFALRPDAPPITPAPPTREWMDRIPDRHAYRCLPLAIANAHGWTVGAPCDLAVVWDGGPRHASMRVDALDGTPGLGDWVSSHFAFGIVTFSLGYLFRTPPGWNLLATGPLNQPKDGIAPLSGVIETSWLPYPFTMNWQMTRPGRVEFERGEPVCMVFPVPASAVSAWTPEVRNLGDDPELERQAHAWRERRMKSSRRFDQRDPATLAEAWQRYYFLGKLPDGSPAPADHVAKLRAAEPVDRRGSRSEPGRVAERPAGPLPDEPPAP
jgi:hypothetical protein